MVELVNALNKFESSFFRKPFLEFLMLDLLNLLLKVLLSKFLFSKGLIPARPISTQLAVLRIQSLILDLNCVEVLCDDLACTFTPFLGVKLFNLVV